MTRSRLVALIGAALAVLSLAFAWTYHAGRAQGANDERTRTVDSTRHVLVDSSKAAETRIATRAVAIEKADTAAAVARAKHEQIARRIVPVTDSTVSIDGGPPVADVPASLVIPEIHTCQQAIAADTLDLSLVRAQLVDMTKDRDFQTARADLDEANAVKVPRLGFKSGVAAGAALVALVMHFLR